MENGEKVIAGQQIQCTYSVVRTCSTHSTRTETETVVNAHCLILFSETLVFERSVTSTALYSSHVQLGGEASSLFQFRGKARQFVKWSYFARVASDTERVGQLEDRLYWDEMRVSQSCQSNRG